MTTKTGRYQNVRDAQRILSSPSMTTKTGRYQNVLDAMRMIFLSLYDDENQEILKCTQCCKVFFSLYENKNQEILKSC
jgi:hypothetical protein